MARVMAAGGRPPSWCGIFLFPQICLIENCSVSVWTDIEAICGTTLGLLGTLSQRHTIVTNSAGWQFHCSNFLLKICLKNHLKVPFVRASGQWHVGLQCQKIQKFIFAQMCKIIINRLRETSPAGRARLRHEIRVPILYHYTPLSTYDLFTRPLHMFTRKCDL